MVDEQRCSVCGATREQLAGGTDLPVCTEAFHRPEVGRWAVGTDVNPDADVIVHDERVTDRVVLRTVDVEGPDGFGS